MHWLGHNNMGQFQGCFPGLFAQLAWHLKVLSCHVCAVLKLTQQSNKHCQSGAHSGLAALVTETLWDTMGGGSQERFTELVWWTSVDILFLKNYMLSHIDAHTPINWCLESTCNVHDSFAVVPAQHASIPQVCHLGLPIWWFLHVLLQK